MENNHYNPNLPQTSPDKTMAMVAYLTLIGWIIAFVTNRDKKDPLVAYHVRQMLGVLIAGLATGILGIIPFIGWILYLPLLVVVIIMWVSGLVNAINGVQKPVLILGNKFQEWFATLE